MPVLHTYVDGYDNAINDIASNNTTTIVLDLIIFQHPSTITKRVSEKSRHGAALTTI